MTKIQRKSAMKSDLTQSNAEQEPKKQVQWKDSCRVRPFQICSANERGMVWYKQKDYREFKKERKAAATLAGAIGVATVEETDFVSCRGIEYMVDKAVYEQKVKLQRRACVAVLTAQMDLFDAADESHEEPDLVTSTAIPKAYSKYAKLAQADACRRAYIWASCEEEQETAEPASPSPENDACEVDASWSPSKVASSLPSPRSVRAPVVQQYQSTMRKSQINFAETQPQKLKMAMLAPVA